MAEEIKLLQAALRGDTAAFERLVVHYQSLVCAILFSGTGKVDVSEELAQETFLRAWQNLVQLKNLERFRSWLCSIARNLMLDYLRDPKKLPLQTSDLTELQSHSTITPCETLISREEQAMMDEALLRIPENYRDVLVLFYRQQQSVAIVAEQLELSEEAVRTRLYRGRELLREEVAGRIEKTLERTAPGKHFTKAVMVAVGGLTLGTAATSQAAGVSTTAAGTSTFLTGIGVKIAAAAAAIIIGAGAWMYYANLPDKTETVKPVVTDSLVQQNDTPGETSVTETPVTVKPAGPKTEAIAAQVPAVPVAENTQPLPPVQKTIAEPNIAYEFKPRGVLSGLITDRETGQPVTDAEISIFISHYYTTKTGSNGFYYFDTIDENGNFRIRINSNDYVGISDYDKQPMVNLQKDKQIVQHFKLPKACKLEVLVVDPNGLPITAARIYATVLSSDRNRQIGNSMYSRQTDKAGKMLLGGFPANDDYLITVTHDGPSIKVEDKPVHSISKWDYAPAGVKVHLDKPGQTESVEVVLEKGQSVRGLATYKDGQPADDVKIIAYPDWWHCNYCPQSANVEPNGLFTLEQIVPGNYRIQANIPTGEGSSTGHGLFTCALPLENDKLLDVKVPFNSPKSLASIRGKVKVFGDKKPSYVNLDAINSKGQYQSSRRIADGRWDDASNEFVIDRLEPGIYSLRFSGDGIEEKTLENITAPAEGLEVVLEYIGKLKLTGAVADAQTQKPIGEFQVRVRKLQTLRGPHYVQPNQSNSFVNTDGKFEVDIVGPGVYQVQVQSKGYAPIWSDEINTDQNTPISIALAAGGATIRGIVLNEAGQPVKDAKVNPLSLAGGTDWSTKDLFISDIGAVTSNEKGEFTLTNLPAGQETLKVTHSNYAFVLVRDIPVVVGQSADNIKVVLSSGGITEGYVYDADGLPLEGEVIYAQDDYGYSGSEDEEAGRLGTATSDPNGFYRIKGLPEQICYLKRQNEWSVTGVIRRTLFARTGKTARVDFGGSIRLTGQVVLDGKPLVNEKLLLASDGNPHFGNFKANSSTDAQGKFIFRGIIGAKLAVYYRQADSTMEWVKAATIGNIDRDTDLGVIPKGFSVLCVTFQHPEPAWKISQVYLAKDKAVSEALMAKPPTTSTEPYIISPVAPGTYKLQVQRDDGLLFNQEIAIPENQEQVDLKVDLPAGTARVYGTFSAKQLYVALTREDKTIQKNVIKTGSGSYEAVNLPPGKYYLGAGLTPEESSLSFYLGKGQQLMMNLDDTSFAPFSAGMLIVQVVSDDGQLIEKAQLCLKAANRTVEPYAQSGSDTIFMTQAGQYTLHISCEGYKDNQQTVTLNALKTGENPNLRKNKITIFLEPDAK
jgi:RNA polymerase sigma factor (sigma-70 family)